MNKNQMCMNCKNVEQDFLAYLIGHLDNSAKIYRKIIPTLQVRTLEKREVILDEGEICNTAFWLQSGYGRYFKTRVDEEGFTRKDTVIFCKPGRIVFVNGFFLTGCPSEFSFELAAGSVIVPFSKQCFEFLRSRGHEVASIANKILTLDKLDVMERTEMIKMKPRERYEKFLSSFGVDIEQSFAVKEVAAYLGLRPSYLSRLRGEYRRKKIGLIKCLQTVFFLFQLI